MRGSVAMTGKPVKVIRKKLRANVEHLDQLCAELRENLGSWRSEGELFACDLLLREVMLNAIMHGCPEASDSMVRCKLSFFSDGLQITVQDEGCGFDRNVWMARPYDPDKDSGRGLMIIRRYADRFRYNYSGNCLSIKKRLQIA